MTEQSERDLTPLPDGYRWITWDIGAIELQKSAMTVETFGALRNGVTNVKRIRDSIRLKRKLFVRDSKGEWTESPSDRFVNEAGGSGRLLSEQ